MKLFRPVGSTLFVALTREAASAEREPCSTLVLPLFCSMIWVSHPPPLAPAVKWEQFPLLCSLQAVNEVYAKRLGPEGLSARTAPILHFQLGETQGQCWRMGAPWWWLLPTAHTQQGGRGGGEEVQGWGQLCQGLT